MHPKNAYRMRKESAMNIDFGPSILNLPREGLIALRDAKGARVQCLSGALWITEEGQADDVVLREGRCLVVGHAGLTLILALRESELRVTVRRAGHRNVIRRVLESARPHRPDARFSVPSAASA